jgi:hypothetical protein
MQEKETNVLPKLQLSNTFYEYRKYNILKIIDNTPHCLSRLYKSEMPKLIDVNRQTFANWLNAGVTDTLEIPSIKLAFIAKILKVPIEELINIPLPEISIKTESQKFHETFLQQTGLVI